MVPYVWVLKLVTPYILVNTLQHPRVRTSEPLKKVRDHIKGPSNSPDIEPPNSPYLAKLLMRSGMRVAGCILLNLSAL